MNHALACEDRLRLMAAHANAGGPVSGPVCTVYQQDIADALALIGALKIANREQAEAVAALTQALADAHAEVPA